MYCITRSPYLKMKVHYFKNIESTVEIAFLQAEIIGISVLEAALLNFALLVMSHIHVLDPIESGKTRNMRFVVETAFLTGRGADM